MGGMAVTRSSPREHDSAGRHPYACGAPARQGADKFLAGRSGAAAWVVKPFTAQELRGAVDGAVAPAAE